MAMARSTGRAGETGIATLPPQITNGDFEKGLAGWHVVSGTAFAGQPVLASKIGAKDVVIDGRPLVPLGGDFWYTPYAIGQNGRSLIRVVAKTAGILDSNPFAISRRWLAFRLGGSGGGTVSLELRVPAATAKAKKRKALDKPDADGYVAIRVATPAGSDPLTETAWDLFGKEAKTSLQGSAAKIRLRVNLGKGAQRLLADDIRLEQQRPPRFRRPLWGWADIHCHPMAQAGFGDLLAGHMHGPVEDLGSCWSSTATSTATSCARSRSRLVRPPQRRRARHDRLEDPDAGRERRARLQRLAHLRRDHPHQDPPGLDPAGV